MRWENVLGKIQPSEQYNEEPRGCVSRIHLWPFGRDDRSGVLIGAGGERRSDWPAYMLSNDISTRLDREPAREDRSRARVHASCYTLKKYIRI